MNILYCFHGQRCHDEFVKSLASLRIHHPGANVYVITDSLIIQACHIDSFSIVETTSSLWGFSYKISAICSAKIQRFIYLDTDTLVYQPIHDLWQCTDIHGISGVREPLGNTFMAIPELVKPHSWENFSSTTIELNSGVLGINKDICGSSFFSCLLNAYDDLSRANQSYNSAPPDQPALAYALLSRCLTPYVLDLCYNFRPYYFQSTAFPIHIWHAHLTDYFPRHSIRTQATKLLVTYTPIGLKVRSSSVIYRFLVKGMRFFRFAIDRFKNSFL